MNGAHQQLRKWAPAAVGVAVFWGLSALMVHASLRYTDAPYTYPLDDAYIHLSLAKSLATSGVFGVSPGQFASASSSVGWPLLLAACIRLMGDHTWLPLALNLGIGAFVPVIVAHQLNANEAHVPTWVRFAMPTAIVVVAPLPTLALLGMEHVLHSALTLLFVFEAAHHIRGARRNGAALVIYAALLSSIRYEAIFLVFFVGVALTLRGRWRTALASGISVLLPIVAFGIYSKLHGGMFLPNSVALKGRKIIFHDASDVFDLLGGDLADRLSANPHLLILFAALAAALFAAVRGHLPRRFTFYFAVTLATMATHIVFAGIGWFFRYEGYLVILALAVLAVAVPRVGGELRAMAALVVGVFTIIAPLAKRATQAADQTPTACRNIFEQQVQMGRFLGQYFPNQTVAVNDIGAVAYFHKGPLVDLMGLASLNVAKAKGFRLETELAPEMVQSLTGQVKIAIVYEEWLGKSIPASWALVGSWHIENRRSPAYSDVSIYAPHEADLPEVYAAARSFMRELPTSVFTRGPASFGQAPYLPNDADRSTASVRLTRGAVLELLPTDASGHILRAELDSWGRIALPGIAPFPVRDRTLLETSAIINEQQGRSHSTHVDGQVHGQVHARLARKAPTHLEVFGDVPERLYMAFDEPPSLAALVAMAGTLKTPLASATVYRRTADGSALNALKVRVEDLANVRTADEDLVCIHASPDPR